MKKFIGIFLLGLLLSVHYVEAQPPSPPYSLPSQTGNSGKFLTTDGTNESWGTAGTDGNDTEINRLATAIKALASAPMNGTVGAGTPSTGVFTTVTAGNASSLLLGTAGSAVGSIGLRNATSGTLTLQPITGALGTPTFVFGTTYTDAKWCSYATATGFTCNETAPQAASATLTSLAGLTETNGGIPYGTGDNAYAWLAAGTANYLLQANGAAAPSWVTNLTIGTLSAGAAGMTVDADGDVTAKSLSTTRTDSPDYLRVYEATSDGDLYAEWAAPATGTGFTATTRYKFPVAAPSGNQVMSFPTPTDSATQGEWITPLINTTGEAILSSTTLPLNADGNTTLYTVPAGKTAVLTKAVLVAGADAGTSDLTIGRAGTLNDFLATQNLDNVNAAGDVAFFAPILHADTQADIKKTYAAGIVIKAVVANQAGGASNTLHLFGFLY